MLFFTEGLGCLPSRRRGVETGGRVRVTESSDDRAARRLAPAPFFRVLLTVSETSHLPNLTTRNAGME